MLQFFSSHFLVFTAHRVVSSWFFFFLVAAKHQWFQALCESAVCVCVCETSLQSLCVYLCLYVWVASSSMKNTAARWCRVTRTPAGRWPELAAVLAQRSSISGSSRIRWFLMRTFLPSWQSCLECHLPQRKADHNMSFWIKVSQVIGSYMISINSPAST